MGCDIHTYIEVYDDKKQKWIMAHGLRKSPYDNKLDVPYADKFNDRDYDLFGILTDGVVRGKGYGFFAPKGLPSDASDFVRKSFTVDDHTPSYLTFQEIQDIKSIKVEISGMIEKIRLVKIKKLLKKDNYWIKSDLDELLYPYCGLTSMPGHVKFKIEVPIGYVIDDFLKYIKRAKDYQLGFSNSLDKIRIVFWFDN